MIEARDGKEGLKLLMGARADLLITDLVMPDMEGYAVLTEMQEKHPAVKIIVISGGVRSNTRTFLDIAKKLGADKVFTKPFATEALLTAINELLPRRRAGRPGASRVKPHGPRRTLRASCVDQP